jgi:hypothetical protein
MKFITFLMVLVFSLSGFQAQETNKQESQDRLWKPVADEVYLQERSEVIFTKQPVQQISYFNGSFYAIMDGELHIVQGQELQKSKNAPQKIQRLMSLGQAFWAVTEQGLHRFQSNRWEKLSDEKIVDMCLHLDQVYAATQDDIFRIDNKQLFNIVPDGGYLSSDITMLMEDGTQVLADPVKLGPISRIESYSGTLHILRKGQLVQLAGKVVNEYFIDWGQLPSRETRDMLRMGSRLIVSTDRGLGVLRGASMFEVKGKDGLPVEDTYSLTKGFDGDVWIGTSRGAIRMLENDWHYFGADHWLPDNKVNGIATGDKKVFIATDGGIGIIHYEPFTLQKKVSHYEQHLNEWGHKRLGFIHTVYKLGDEWVREVSDNDGGHTATYLSAMSYKYAATGDPKAREEAIDAFRAMIWLDRVTPIDGFVARAIWSVKGDKGEMGRRGSGGLPAKWYPTDDGNFFWKGDTSSDEVIAHFYSVALFHDLVAEGRDKELAREHIRRMASYIMENGWVYIDMDGKPTRWGRWNPEYLLRPYGWSDRGVNGLEVLAFMQTALNITGEEKFRSGYQQLVNWGYAENTIRQKNTFPPSTIAPWDDNLAFESYVILMRYEKDPEMRSMYLRSLERTWEIKRMEKIPWFNFTYASVTNNDGDLTAAVQHLREWTLDCIEHNYRNSHRDDLFVDSGYTSYEGGLKAISPRETSVKRGSRRAIVLDGGVGGRRIMEPVGFIRDYWMGRHYGFIEAPQTQDPELLSVKPAAKGSKGAAPYKGPGRPDF